MAVCVEVAVNPSAGRFEVTEICEAFECGPILNPANLLSQVQGCIVMGLGGALSEELEFEDGKILNPRFSGYRVPRFSDVPRIDVHLVENTDIPPAGGGETPIIAVAPAIGNAVFAATGEAPPLDAPPLELAPREPASLRTLVANALGRQERVLSPRGAEEAEELGMPGQAGSRDDGEAQDSELDQANEG